jgi:replicative DNA helicase
MAGPVTLKNYCEKEGDLEHVGGTEYLAELASSVITMINAEDYGLTIYDLYMRRELIAPGQDLLRHAYEPRLEQEHGAMAIIEQTEGRLFRLAEAGNTGGVVQTFYEVLRKAAESAQLAFNHTCRQRVPLPLHPPILAAMPRGAMRRRKEAVCLMHAWRNSYFALFMNSCTTKNIT